MVADVVIFLGIHKMLTYAIPEGMAVGRGCRVIVPLRDSRRVGIVVSLHERQGIKGLKGVFQILDKEPLIPEGLINMLWWCARYYHASIGSCISLAFPPYLRKGKQIEIEPSYIVFKADKIDSARVWTGKKQRMLLDAIPQTGILLERLKKIIPGSTSSIAALVGRGLIELKEMEKDISIGASPIDGLRYTKEQAHAIAVIEEGIKAGEFKTFLIHGITGSGKTEVYLASAMKALSVGRSVIYLVPEISLTPQTIHRIKLRIPFEVAVFHSGLSDKARAVEFFKVARKGVRFVLGARSAIFAPLKDLGLIIVDEEHDSSYKQSEGVPYNARDLSMLRAKKEGAVVVLGSATPSMESFTKAKASEISLINMPYRIGEANLPEIDIIDMRGESALISDDLMQSVEEILLKGEQTLLFINRRGFAAAIVCPGCGKVLTCPNCDRSLTYHKARGVALCHYCGFTLALPEICPFCGCIDMRPLGLGTERIVDEVSKAFPDARILKMDTDEIFTPAKLLYALNAIQNNNVDIIVGTQMIAKGHDFPNLTLVGVVYGEQLLYMPDFRAIERTFQQIVQVTGRAGRRRSATRVIVQTLVPDHPIFDAIKSYDYDGMIRMEEAARKPAGLPPYMHMARCVFSSYRINAPGVVAGQVASILRRTKVLLVGPAPAPITFLRGAYRWHLILKSDNRRALHSAIGSIQSFKVPSYVKLRIDIDPYDML
ncbi:MAG: primosomal protein N' [Thermodesulfobacteriota bacterium]|nr:primosomal protein N' [Thermodesulfobacteriota bacterium]